MIIDYIQTEYMLHALVTNSSNSPETKLKILKVWMAVIDKTLNKCRPFKQLISSNWLSRFPLKLQIWHWNDDFNKIFLNFIAVSSCSARCLSLNANAIENHHFNFVILFTLYVNSPFEQLDEIIFVLSLMNIICLFILNFGSGAKLLICKKFIKVIFGWYDLVYLLSGIAIIVRLLKIKLGFEYILVINVINSLTSTKNFLFWLL